MVAKKPSRTLMWAPCASHGGPGGPAGVTASPRVSALTLAHALASTSPPSLSRADQLPSTVASGQGSVWAKSKTVKPPEGRLWNVKSAAWFPECSTGQSTKPESRCEGKYTPPLCGRGCTALQVLLRLLKSHSALPS